MTQHQLDTAVAIATGESPSVIRRHGFGIADPLDVHFDPEPDDVPPQYLDWERMQEVRLVRPNRRRGEPDAT